MTAKPLSLFIDEAQSFLYGDNLKVELRALDVVPPFEYQVKGDQIFVFEALRKTVSEARLANPERQVADIAIEVLPSAWMSIEEAVSVWNIVPRDFQKEADGDVFKIVFKPFSATLPERYSDAAAVEKAFAKLFKGEIIPGKGDFEYRGQQFVMEKSIDPLALPEFPLYLNEKVIPELDSVIFEAAKQSGSSFSSIYMGPFAEGVSVLGKERYDHVLALTERWVEQIDGMRSVLARAIPAVQDLLIKSDLQTLYCAEDEYNLDQHSDGDLAELRTYFPELSSLPASVLHDLFYDFQTKIIGYRHMQPCRDDDFLFYLLGRLYTTEANGQKVVDVGRYLAYLLLQGMGTEVVREECARWIRYDLALRDMYSTVAGIIRYLKPENDKDIKVGYPITVLSDFFTRMGRTDIQIA